MMTYVTIAIGLLVFGLLIIIVRDLRKLRSDFNKFSRKIRNEKSSLAFLIDQDMVVKDTNYYALKKEMKDDQPSILGNVLHCKVGCDSGLCGTGLSCQTCPVRYVIKNAFQLKRDFNDVKANMQLYDENHEVTELEVTVDGELVYVNSEPYMLVKVTT